MTKFTIIDIIDSLSGTMDDVDYIKIIDYCSVQIRKPRNLFKAEKLIKEAADFERLSIP